MGTLDRTEDRVAELAAENDSLRSAIILVHRISKLVRATMELESTYYALLTGVTAGVGLGLNRAMILSFEEDRSVLVGNAAVGPADHEEASRVWRSIEAAAPDLETLYEAGLSQLERRGRLDTQVRSLSVDLEGGTPMALAIRQGKMVAGAGSDNLSGLLHLPTSVAAPMRMRSRVCGIMYADNRFTERPLSPTELLVFNLVADYAGRAIENARKFEQVAHDARTDSLTGLGHHGALMQSLADAVDHAVGPVGLIMLDLDDFKRVNDAHGHLVGDAVLVGVATRIRDAVRAGAQAFRYGGEEFAVLLPGADRRASAIVGERLRATIGEMPFIIGDIGHLAVTCSVGVASLPRDANTAEELLELADSTMLRAKIRGKNRVSTTDDGYARVAMHALQT